MWTRYPRGILLTGLLFACGIASLQGDDEVVAFNEIATVHRDVIVPIPSEIFSVLDDFEVQRSVWRDQLQVPTNLQCQDRTHFALFLGHIVAEGFLAVEAQDREAIRSLGRSVLSVAEELGLRQTILRHSKSIIEKAEDGDWDAVRQEFDATRHTVRETMNRRRDQDLAHCVSVGGWIRGMEIVTALMAGKYRAKAAEILSQPELISHFIETFESHPRFGNENRMRSVIKGLRSLQPLMTRTGPATRQEVNQINAICQGLRKETLSP